MKNYLGNIIEAVTIMIIVILSFVGGTIVSSNKEVLKDTVYIHKDSLSEWQIFQLALIEVESNYNSIAISSKNAKGILQIMPSYINEVNRLQNTFLKHEDVCNDSVSLYCFDIIQGTYNKEHNIDKAIYLHNPNAGAWYKRRVLAKMEEIRRREEIRALL